MIKLVSKWIFLVILLCPLAKGEDDNLSAQRELEHRKNFFLLTSLQGSSNDGNTSEAILHTIQSTTIDLSGKNNEYSTTNQISNTPDNLEPSQLQDTILDSLNNHISTKINKIVHSPSPTVKTIQVPVEVPKLYAVHIPHPVPVPVHIRVPVTIEKPYPVEITKTITVPVEKPVYIRVPQPIQIPVAQPYPVLVPKPVEVRVPYPVYINSPEGIQSPGVKNSAAIDVRNNFDKNAAASTNNEHAALFGSQNTLLNSYRPSNEGGIHGSSFNRYQTAEYQKTW